MQKKEHRPDARNKSYINYKSGWEFQIQVKYKETVF